MTPTQQLAALKLGQPLEQYVTDRRMIGHTWSTIAADLSLDTGGVVNISRETLRQWYGQAAA